MAPADSSGAKPIGPVALRIKLRYDDVDAMVQRFAGNVGRSGLFLPTKSLHPVGTEVKFELRIANDTPVLVGLGKVKAARPPDPNNPKAAFGLAIELMRVTRDGREIIIRMLERRRQLALPEVAIPLPEDVEAARRMDVETQPGVPQPVPALESKPETITQVMPPVPEVTPTPAPVPIPTRPTPIPDLLTSPRPAVGPVATARRTSRIIVAPVLAPEAVRAKRPELADLVAKAVELTGPVKAIDLDEPDVDVGKAIARARVLAGGGALDGELEALLDSSAAPLVVDVEAASAELARQLGGIAIAKKDRSARWAPPPPVAEPAAPIEVAPLIESQPVEAVQVLESQPIPIATSEIEIVDEAPRRLPTASGEMDALAAEAAMAIAGGHAIERPDEPPMPPVGLDVPTVIPGVTPAPTTTQVDVDDPELLSFERALDAARVHTGVSAPAPAGDDEIPELDADLVDELPGESTQIGAVSPYGEEPVQASYAAFEHEHPSTAGAEIPDPNDDELIDDVDVLAEADAYDDDLLSANGERDSSAYPVVAPDVESAQDFDPVLTPAPVVPRDEFVHDVFTPPPEPSPFRALSPRDDFAHRLALDEEDEAQAAPVGHYPNEPARHDRLPQLHGDDDDDDDEFDEPHNYTIAEDPDYENPEVEFDEQHGFGKRAFELAESDDSLDRALEQDPVEDLDNALSTLDVDLDHLSVPPERRQPQARPLPGMPPARAGRVSDVKQTTQPLPRQAPRVRRPDSDDGVIIDFDDDDD